MHNFKNFITLNGDREDFFFVQIGSNDGITHDPLYEYINKFKWSGIMVEPVKHMYDRLVHNHRDKQNIQFKNVAISNDGSEKIFYSARGDAPDGRGNRISSFSKQHIQGISKRPFARAFKNNFSGFFKEEKIKTLTFNQLVDGINRVDLLHVDAEGHDFAILKSIDYDTLAPGIILFETRHIPTRQALRFLRSKGYNAFKDGRFDAMAIHNTYISK